MQSTWVQLMKHVVGLIATCADMRNLGVGCKTWTWSTFLYVDAKEQL